MSKQAQQYQGLRLVGRISKVADDNIEVLNLRTHFKVGHPDPVEESESLIHFWFARGLDRSIDYIASPDKISDPDLMREYLERVRFIDPVYPISDLGIKVGSFVTRVQFCFHTVDSIIFVGGCWQMIRHPVKTWKKHYGCAGQLMRRGGVPKTWVQSLFSGLLCGAVMLAPTLLVALGVVKG